MFEKYKTVLYRGDPNTERVMDLVNYGINLCYKTKLMLDEVKEDLTKLEEKFENKSELVKILNKKEYEGKVNCLKHKRKIIQKGGLYPPYACYSQLN